MAVYTFKFNFLSLILPVLLLNHDLTKFSVTSSLCTLCRSYWSMSILPCIVPIKGGPLPSLPLAVAKCQGSSTTVLILPLHVGVYILSNYLP